jgi:hypothetical protein
VTGEKLVHALNFFCDFNTLGFRYFHEILKILLEISEPILLAQIFAKLLMHGCIHPVSTGIEPRKVATVLVKENYLLTQGEKAEEEEKCLTKS